MTIDEKYDDTTDSTTITRTVYEGSDPDPAKQKEVTQEIKKGQGKDGDLISTNTHTTRNNNTRTAHINYDNI